MRLSDALKQHQVKRGEQEERDRSTKERLARDQAVAIKMPRVSQQEQAAIENALAEEREKERRSIEQRERVESMRRDFRMAAISQFVNWFKVHKDFEFDIAVRSFLLHVCVVCVVSTLRRTGARGGSVGREVLVDRTSTARQAAQYAL